LGYIEAFPLSEPEKEKDHFFRICFIDESIKRYSSDMLRISVQVVKGREVKD
jgi:hypothetical protein